MNKFLKSAKKFPIEGAVALIKLYKKLISPFFPPSCRFYPSCSSYAIEAFHVHGFLKGMALSAWRVLRCNPFNKGGYDPVPLPSADKNPTKVLRNSNPDKSGQVHSETIAGFDGK